MTHTHTHTLSVAGSSLCLYAGDSRKGGSITARKEKVSAARSSYIATQSHACAIYNSQCRCQGLDRLLETGRRPLDCDSPTYFRHTQ